MWSMEISVFAPSARSLEQLGGMAGALVEALEESHGEMAPVITAQFHGRTSSLQVSIDIGIGDPVEAVSRALDVVCTEADHVEVPLGDVRAVSLNLAHEADLAADTAQI